MKKEDPLVLTCSLLHPRPQELLALGKPSQLPHPWYNYLLLYMLCSHVHSFVLKIPIVFKELNNCLNTQGQDVNPMWIGSSSYRLITVGNDRDIVHSVVLGFGCLSFFYHWRAGMHTTAHLWKSEDSLWESVLSSIWVSGIWLRSLELTLPKPSPWLHIL